MHTGLSKTLKARSPSFVATSHKRVDSFIKPTASIVSIKIPANSYNHNDSLTGGSVSHRSSLIVGAGAGGLSCIQEPVSCRSSVSAKRSFKESFIVNRRPSVTKKPSKITSMLQSKTMVKNV